ncbi:MAG: nuclear transport factor 2 family protein [Pseudomonadales bacterium]
MKTEQALFANDTFYLIFTSKNFEAMDRLWAIKHPILCIHPGWPALTERKDVMESWKRILENPGQPGMDFYNASALVVGDIVLVTCYEELSDSVMVATNGFVKERGEIKLFHHHAGPCSQPPRPTSAQPDSTV